MMTVLISLSLALNWLCLVGAVWVVGKRGGVAYLRARLSRLWTKPSQLPSYISPIYARRSSLLEQLPIQAGDYALKVTGDSMVEAMIQDGDVVIMRPVKDPQGIREGTIVAARVESGTTLKSFHRQGNQVQLKPANPNYPVMEFPAELVDVQGRLVAVWRGIDPDLIV